MSFKAYLEAVERKTGLDVPGLRDHATAKGWWRDGALLPGVTATIVTDGLKAEFGLGHGHAMAVYALLKGLKGDPDVLC